MRSSKELTLNTMSKDKKSMPNPVGKKGPSDYQSGKTSNSKIEVLPINKKKK